MQAPQLPRSQTRFGPVTSRRLRSVSSRVLRGSTVQLISSPLTLSVSGRLAGEDLRLVLGGLGLVQRRGGRARSGRPRRPPGPTLAGSRGGCGRQAPSAAWGCVLSSTHSPFECSLGLHRPRPASLARGPEGDDRPNRCAFSTPRLPEARPRCRTRWFRGDSELAEVHGNRTHQHRVSTAFTGFRRPGPAPARTCTSGSSEVVI